MPPAHSFDRESTLSVLLHGGRVAFHAAPPSLLLPTLQLARPTIFSSTPRLWNTLHARFQAELAAEIARIPATPTMGAAAAEVARRRAEACARRRVGSLLGGRQHTIGTGGAATSPAVLRAALGCQRGQSHRRKTNPPRKPPSRARHPAPGRLPLDSHTGGSRWGRVRVLVSVYSCRAREPPLQAGVLLLQTEAARRPTQPSNPRRNLPPPSRVARAPPSFMFASQCAHGMVAALHAGFMAQTFGCGVVEGYGTTETGSIAWDSTRDSSTQVRQRSLAAHRRAAQRSAGQRRRAGRQAAQAGSAGRKEGRQAGSVVAGGLLGVCALM